ncbi:SAC3/GANP/Nin1/mts3/eIF-3 p25 family-domain-containing protein [Microdochium trichocladiopsis]|uniref:SAC3/GANP/Nin1/mts3/eIF-3 p25 family-domain-containing protein n=1 Tax=Microdochium trichocladiopsis TaxID=1682393 RepID=A0A9P8XUK8_9PEZI|nr:SAC3/GANP/Nin1/mts3/eIF-3 p25 family-domain-containing protein [Microdochium trichocladiopsis]KAH7018191.1 SAC3/GANP/Nin1/mts3/eIF-3 p25 family-domain-containing protein [Microdochium trichocladiopsis]
MPFKLGSWRRRSGQVEVQVAAATLAEDAPATTTLDGRLRASHLWRRRSQARRGVLPRAKASLPEPALNVSSVVPALASSSSARLLAAAAAAPPPLQDHHHHQRSPSSPPLAQTTISNEPAEHITTATPVHTPPRIPEETPVPTSYPIRTGSTASSTATDVAIDLSSQLQSPPPPPDSLPPNRQHNPLPQTIRPPATMADRTLQTVLKQLQSNPNLPYPEASSLLSKAKIALLQLNALTPTPKTPGNLLAAARDVYEAGALFSIRAKDADAFTRYVSQLQPFYELPPSSGAKPNDVERNKVTGLYLLLLLTQGRYGEFHSELESLSCREPGVEIENDRFLGYPIKLERWLMEGSYDRVWKAMKSREVPCEEYGVFFEILTSQIRSEIASSSERAYPSLPLSSTKSLLFLESEGAVVEFARQRGWAVRDGQIYFPSSSVEGEDGEEKDISQMVIENTLGYARELETIV